jgi:hypothetical protein
MTASAAFGKSGHRQWERRGFVEESLAVTTGNSRWQDVAATSHVADSSSFVAGAAYTTA